MKNLQMKPQDILLLLKLISIGEEQWKQKDIADELCMSQSEISESVKRCKYSGLLNPKGKKVARLALMEFLQYGITYVFPQKPGPIVKGIPTAHSAEPLSKKIVSDEFYVWPSVKGQVRGHSIEPLYPSVVKIIHQDMNNEKDLPNNTLYEMLALVDSLRVGKAREKQLALKELQKRVLTKAYVD